MNASLIAAVAEDDTALIGDALSALDGVTMTLEMLQSTPLPKSVGRLRKHTNCDVTKKAKALVAKWKAVVVEGPEARVKREPESKRKSDAGIPLPKSEYGGAAPHTEVADLDGEVVTMQTKRRKVVVESDDDQEAEQMDEEMVVRWQRIAADPQYAV